MARVFICLFIGGLLIFTACSPASDAQTTAFIASDLTILPEVMTPGDSTTIGVTVTNTGEQAGTYPVVLKIDGVIAETKHVTLAGGASQNVTFVYFSTFNTRDHVITIDQLKGVLQVLCGI